MLKLSERYAVIILVVATVFWGSTFAFTKELVKYMNPLWLVVFRFGVSGLFLLIIFFPSIKKSITSIFKGEKAGVLTNLIGLGVINILAIVLQTVGLQEISVANSSFITSLSFLFIPFVDHFLRDNPVSSNMKFSVMVALVGLYFMAYGFSHPDKFIWGDFFTLLCALLYSVFIIVIDELAKKLDSGTIMFFCFMVTAIGLGLFLPFFSYFHFLGADQIFITPWDSQFVFYFCFIVIFGTVVPYVMMGIGQRKVSAQVAGLIYILEPVFAMAIALLFFSEQLVLAKIIGGSIVMIAQVIGLKSHLVSEVSSEQTIVVDSAQVDS